MCGFVAIARFDGKPVDRSLLVRMRDTMIHRGPDDADLWIAGEVGLAHRRLSIVDLSAAGRQPMSNEDGTLRLLFNGEIYNHVELRRDLLRRGHRFSSQSDGEVILHLYEETGERCVEHLIGMFAFVIWDARTRTFFGARDRLGIKPFNYLLRADRFICASEVKAILEDPETEVAPDMEGLAELIACGYPQAGRTLFDGVRQLGPGETILVHQGAARVESYWDVVYDYRHDRDLATVSRELADLLDDAVRIHCRSDAPLGCHLSGGLDSSTVVALASRHRTPLPTFTIRFEGGTYYDESRYARAMARHVGAEYHEDIPGSADFFGMLARLVWYNEMPLPNSGAFSYYTGSRLAARHVKVSLTGHGGDEIFGGYPAQFQLAFGTTAMFGGDRPAARGDSLAKRLGALRRRGIRGLIDAVGRRLSPDARKSVEDLWVGLHCSVRPFDNPLLHPGFSDRLRAYDFRSEYLRLFRAAPTDVLFDRCLYHDMRVYLPSLLHLEDRASMAVSLESRVPLLDHRVIEYLATVPPELKVPGLVPKGLLREVARTLLPDEVMSRRDKAPFPVPMNDWLASPPRGIVESILHADACLDRGVLNPDWIRKPLDPNAIWLALNLELWFRIFIDRESPKSLTEAGLELIGATSW